MNYKNSSLVGLQFFLSIFVFIAITADRNLLIFHYIHEKANTWITAIFVLIVFFLYLSENIIKGQIKFNRRKKSILTILLLISLYFFIHNIIFPTSIIPFKYSILSMLIIVFITKKINISPLINGFANIGLLLSFAIILQQILLLLFHSGDLSEFNILLQKASREGRGPGFVFPYGLGLIEYTFIPTIDFKYFEYFRPSLFTHEPKHASSIILFTLSTVLLSSYSSKIKTTITCIHLIAIIFIMSFSSYLILILTFSIYFIYKNKVFPIYYAPGVIIIPFILTWLLDIIIPLFSSNESIFYLRLLSALTTSGLNNFRSPSLFASGAYPNINDDKDSMLYYIYGQYGIIALVLISLFLYLIIRNINKQGVTKKIESTRRVATILLVNIFVVYNLYVFSDFLNLFSVFLIILIFHVLDNSNLVDKIKYSTAY